MAIAGKYNIIETVRLAKAPYWRLFENNEKRTASNYAASAEFSDPTLGLEESLMQLDRAIDRLTPGRYIMTAYAKPGDKRSGIDCHVELVSGGGMAGIGSTGGGFHLDGIGAVTAENFEVALTQKIAAMQKEERERLEREADKKLIRELQLQLRQKEAMWYKGIVGVGGLLYGQVIKTEAGKQFIGVAREFMQAAKQVDGGTDKNAPTIPEAGQNTGIAGPGEQEATEEQNERLGAAIETLSTDNPEFLAQMEALAKMKAEDPETFQIAVDQLKSE